MKIVNERKLVTIEVTNEEMERIEDLDFANVGQFNDVTVDLDSYAEYVEVEVPIIDEAISILNDLGVEADVIQFMTL